jgi:hypothetical protein
MVRYLDQIDAPPPFSLSSPQVLFLAVPARVLGSRLWPTWLAAISLALAALTLAAVPVAYKRLDLDLDNVSEESADTGADAGAGVGVVTVTAPLGATSGSLPESEEAPHAAPRRRNGGSGRREGAGGEFDRSGCL